MTDCMTYAKKKQKKTKKQRRFITCILNYFLAVDIKKDSLSLSMHCVILETKQALYHK